MRCDNPNCACGNQPATTNNEAKVLAETRKIEMDIEEAQVRIAKQRAEVDKIAREEKRAQAKHQRELQALDIALQKGAMQLETDRIVRDRNQREEEMILACDWNHHVYNFIEDVDQESVLGCMTQINQWVRQHAARQYDNSDAKSEDLHIEIIFDSPGGSVFDGMHLFDFLRWIRSHGHHITTVALGSAASMAGILVQAGTTRVIGAESYILIHRMSEARFMDRADADVLNDRLARLKKMEGRVLNIFADRAARALCARDDTLSYDDQHAKTKALIEQNWTKKDWWLDSDEALAYGLVDEVR